MKKIITFAIALLFISAACTSEMRPIDYGKDNCEQCRMTVMNPQYGAGMLTAKGKVLAFDAGECLVRYVKTKGKNDKEQYFVSDYHKPGTLIDAGKAVFVHGENIQSPMGGNLAACSNLAAAEALQQELGGELLTWEQLIGK